MVQAPGQAKTRSRGAWHRTTMVLHSLVQSGARALTVPYGIRTAVLWQRTGTAGRCLPADPPAGLGGDQPKITSTYVSRLLRAFLPRGATTPLETCSAGSLPPGRATSDPYRPTANAAGQAAGASVAPYRRLTLRRGISAAKILRSPPAAGNRRGPHCQIVTNIPRPTRADRQGSAPNSDHSISAPSHSAAYRGRR